MIGPGLLQKTILERAPLANRIERACSTSLPFTMMPTCVHSRSTISRTCDVRNTVEPRETNPASRSRITREVTASTPSNGSSRNNKSGLGKSAAASASFFFMPCEYSSVSFFSSSCRSRIERSSSERLRIVSRCMRWMRPTNVRYSRAVRLSKRARSSGITPILRLASSASRGSSMFQPSTFISPPEAPSNPVSIFIVVDLPAPFGPKNP